MPGNLIEQGLIEIPQSGQATRIGLYHPSLLAPNPQRGRVIDRGLDELAATLNEHGQQQPIVARLITETDRKRWPDALDSKQVLLIVQGHRMFFAQPRSQLKMLRVELMLPEEGEDELAYSRRGLRRAAIKMMHSQGYDIFDKVNQYMIWRAEFALEKPKDKDVADYFDISRTEAQRIKTVSQLDQSVAQKIINDDKRPADEIVYMIASRPVHEHEQAYKDFGHLTVASARRLLKDDKKAADTKVTGAGRPRNYVVSIRDEESDIGYIATSLTADQWRQRGGAKAFWEAISRLAHSRELQDRVDSELS